MDQSIARPSSRRVVWTTEDIRQKISDSKVVVFGKGTPEKPKCGFSEKAFSELEAWENEVEVVDVCKDSSIIAALRTVTGRKALPIVFVEGKMVSCSDDLPQMLRSGGLRESVRKVLAN